jgi:hypothetical protein
MLSQVDPRQDANNFSEDVKLPHDQYRPEFVERQAYLFWVEEGRKNALKLSEFAAADNANLAEKKEAQQTTAAVLIGLRRAWEPAKRDVAELIAKLPSEHWPAKWKPGKPLPMNDRRTYKDPSIMPSLVNLKNENKGYTLMQLVRCRATAHVENWAKRKDIIVSSPDRGI